MHAHVDIIYNIIQSYWYTYANFPSKMIFTAVFFQSRLGVVTTRDSAWHSGTRNIWQADAATPFIGGWEIVMKTMETTHDGTGIKWKKIWKVISFDYWEPGNLVAYCGFLSSFFFVLPIEFRIIPCHSWNQAVVFTSPGFDRLLGPLGCAETNRKRLKTNLFTSQAFRKGHHHGSQHLCKATVGLSWDGFSITVPATKTTTFRREILDVKNQTFCDSRAEHWWSHFFCPA